MRKDALIDSGPIVALFNPADSWHAVARKALIRPKVNLKTTWPVMTESMHLLRYSHRTQDAVLEWVERGGVEIENLTGQDMRYMRQRMKKYADLPMDLADASLMAIAERLAIDQVLSVDSDFSIYRKLNGKYLMNLVPV